jgi:hypothetical protein
VVGGRSREMRVEAIAVAESRWVSADVKRSGQYLWAEEVPANRPGILTK